MTDGPHSQHPDLETLSELLDRDASPGSNATREHIRGCEECRVRLADLRRGRDAVAQPVAPLPAVARDEAVGRAVAAAGAWSGAPAAPPVGERPVATVPTAPDRAAPGRAAPGRAARLRWWLAGSAAAAVLLVVIAAVALFGRGTSTGHGTALSAGPAESAKPFAPTARAGDTARSGGDLGDVPNVDVLRSRVAASIGNSSQAAALGGPAPPTTVTAVSRGAPRNGVLVPNVVGTRVCEEQARTLRPQLGRVVYSADLRFKGTSAVVLGFAPTPTAPPATLLVLAPQQGCQLLAEASPS